MVRDTLVGVLGAVLIVGSMVAAINYQEGGPASQDGEVSDAPAPIGKSVWRASSCEAASLYWTPSMEALDEVVGPHLTPSEGPVPGSGLFWLFAYSCDRASVDGLSVPPPSGAAALVAVEEPDDTRNVSAPDGWTAVPTWYAPADSRVSEVFTDHEFNHTPARATVQSSSTPLNDQVRMTIDAPQGTLSADMTVSGTPEERVVEGGLVGTSEETFSVFSGEERMDRRQDGTATVDTQGTTWVERLGLEPTPYQIAYDTQMSWNFTFQHEPWETGSTDGEDDGGSSNASASEASLAGRLLAELPR